MISPQALAELALEIESEDPIDWGYLSIDEKTAYLTMAPSVLEMFAEGDNRELMMLATVLKLVVENFVLNLKLLGQHHDR